LGGSPALKHTYRARTVRTLRTVRTSYIVRLAKQKKDGIPLRDALLEMCESQRGQSVSSAQCVALSAMLQGMFISAPPLGHAGPTYVLPFCRDAIDGASLPAKTAGTLCALCLPGREASFDIHGYIYLRIHVEEAKIAARRSSVSTPLPGPLALRSTGLKISDRYRGPRCDVTNRQSRAATLGPIRR
jgi:hypothetical protein